MTWKIYGIFKHNIKKVGNINLYQFKLDMFQNQTQ